MSGSPCRICGEPIGRFEKAIAAGNGWFFHADHTPEEELVEDEEVA